MSETARDRARALYGAQVDFPGRSHADDCHHWHVDCAYLHGAAAERRRTAAEARAWSTALPDDPQGRLARQVLTDLASTLEEAHP